MVVGVGEAGAHVHARANPGRHAQNRGKDCCSSRARSTIGWGSCLVNARAPTNEAAAHPMKQPRGAHTGCTCTPERSADSEGREEEEGPLQPTRSEHLAPMNEASSSSFEAAHTCSPQCAGRTAWSE